MRKLFRSIRSLFQRKAPMRGPVRPKPSWPEIVELMYDKDLSFPAYDVVKVVYSPDKKERLVLLKRKIMGSINTSLSPFIRLSKTSGSTFQMYPARSPAYGWAPPTHPSSEQSRRRGMMLRGNINTSLEYRPNPSPQFCTTPSSKRTSPEVLFSCPDPETAPWLPFEGAVSEAD